MLIETYKIINYSWVLFISMTKVRFLLSFGRSNTLKSDSRHQYTNTLLFEKDFLFIDGFILDTKMYIEKISVNF